MIAYIIKSHHHKAVVLGTQEYVTKFLKKFLEQYYDANDYEIADLLSYDEVNRRWKWGSVEGSYELCEIIA